VINLLKVVPINIGLKGYERGFSVDLSIILRLSNYFVLNIFFDSWKNRFWIFESIIAL